MHFRKLNNKDWRIIEERIEKTLCSWKSKFLSVGGRLVLINSVLSSLPMYMFSFFEVPRGVLKKIEYYRSRFFWQNDQHNKQGGLGIQNLDLQNKCFLSKWLYKLCNEDGMWHKLLRNKCLKNKTLS